jgi:uncharacterized RDD family membrane protein YckC
MPERVIDPAVSFPAERTHISGRRYIAHAADGLLIGLIVLLLLIPASLGPSALLFAVFVSGFIVVPFAYYVLTQRGTGRSPGKRLVSLRIVDANGSPPSTGALVRRTLPLLVEYIYVIAWVSMMSSAYRQRLGDRWAHTFVIPDEAGVR